MKNILSIDPGRDKCGIAVLSRNKTVLERSVIKRKDLAEKVYSIISNFEITDIIIGSGTTSRGLKSEIEKIANGVRISFIKEEFTTLEARERYFKENPPKGIFRLMPKTLLYPKRPFDDYVAVILGERYIDKAL